MVKASASRAEDPRFESRWRRDFSRSSHTNDLNIGTPVATLPGAWRNRVSAGTGVSGVSILCLGEAKSLICNLSLSLLPTRGVNATWVRVHSVLKTEMPSVRLPVCSKTKQLAN